MAWPVPLQPLSPRGLCGEPVPPARAPAAPPLRDRLPPSAAAATARCRAALPARGEPSSAGSVPPSRCSHLAAARAGVPPNVRAWKEPRGLGGISREGSGTAAPDCAPAGKTFSPRHGPRGGHPPQRSAPRHSEWRRLPVRASTYLPPAAAEGKGSAPAPQRSAAVPPATAASSSAPGRAALAAPCSSAPRFGCITPLI